MKTSGERRFATPEEAKLAAQADLKKLLEARLDQRALLIKKEYYTEKRDQTNESLLALSLHLPFLFRSCYTYF